MKNWLEDLNKTLGLGLILAFIVFLIRGYYGILGEISFWAFLFRWIHVVLGILWIGLLYYFNFVQVAALKAAQADNSAAGISRHVAPRALLFFRWAAVVTWLAGASILGGHFLDAFFFQQKVYVPIGIGAWLGTIMLFNVWVLIWPNQKKILGIVAATDEQKARARKTAGMASRINFVLSIPMLLCMAGASHGLPFMR